MGGGLSVPESEDKYNNQETRLFIKLIIFKYFLILAGLYDLISDCNVGLLIGFKNGRSQWTNNLFWTFKNRKTKNGTVFLKNGGFWKKSFPLNFRTIKCNIFLGRYVF